MNVFSGVHKDSLRNVADKVIGAGAADGFKGVGSVKDAKGTIETANRFGLTQYQTGLENRILDIENAASLERRRKLKEDKPGSGSPGLAATILASVFRSGRLGASEEDDEENLRRPTLLGM